MKGNSSHTGPDMAVVHPPSKRVQHAQGLLAPIHPNANDARPQTICRTCLQLAAPIDAAHVPSHLHRNSCQKLAPSCHMEAKAHAHTHTHSLDTELPASQINSPDTPCQGTCTSCWAGLQACHVIAGQLCSTALCNVPVAYYGTPGQVSEMHGGRGGSYRGVLSPQGANDNLLPCLQGTMFKRPSQPCWQHACTQTSGREHTPHTDEKRRRRLPADQLERCAPQGTAGCDSCRQPLPESTPESKQSTANTH